jgi:hypothetical protein
VNCQLCKRELARDEAVYRFCGGYSDYWMHKFGGSIGSICTACSAHWPPLKGWREPEPCAHCGRPVFNLLRRKQPKLVICGSACRVAASLAKARLRRALQPKACVICGESFAPKRTDSCYCSAACKQKSFRHRHLRLSAEPSFPP